VSGEGQPLDPVSALAQAQGSGMPDPVAALAAGQLPPPAPETAITPNNSADWRQQLLASPVGRLEHGVMDTVYGGLQLGGHIGSGLASAGGLAPNPVSRYIDQATADMDARRKLQDATQEQAVRATGGDPEGFDAGRLIGNVVSPTNYFGGEIGLGSTITNAFPRAAALGRALLQSGYYGAQQPVDDNGNFAAEKIKQGEESVGLGGLLHGAGTIAGKVISPQLRDKVALLLKEDVPLTAGQILGGTVQSLENAGTSIPGIKEIIGNRYRDSLVGLQRASLNRSLAPIGEKLPAGLEGNDAVAHTDRALGDAYNDVLSRMSGTADPTLVRDITQINKDAPSYGVTGNNATKLYDILKNQIFAKAGRGATYTGDTIKDIQSNLRHQAQIHAKSQNPDDKNLADALFDAKDAFDDFLARQNPNEAPRLAKINEGWANFARPQQAAERNMAEGIPTPTQYGMAVRAGGTRGQNARADALQQDLSSAGLTVLPSKLPDSGTPFRHLVQAGLGLAGAGLGGEHLGIPGTEGAAIGAAALGGLAALGGTRMGQALIRHAIATSTANAPAVAAGVQSMAPRLTPALLAAMLKNPGNNAPE
jgi:hypothetical protein